MLNQQPIQIGGSGPAVIHISVTCNCTCNKKQETQPQANVSINQTNHTSFTSDNNAHRVDMSPNPFMMGTPVEFVPVTRTDTLPNTTDKISTKSMTITSMKEYENKSFEELRLEDYMANRTCPRNEKLAGPPKKNFSVPLHDGTRFCTPLEKYQKLYATHNPFTVPRQDGAGFCRPPWDKYGKLYAPVRNKSSFSQTNNGDRFGPSTNNSSVTKNERFQWFLQNTSPFAQTNNGRNSEPSANNSIYYLSKRSGFQWPPENNTPFPRTNNGGNFGPSAINSSYYQDDDDGRFGPSANNSPFCQTKSSGCQWPSENNAPFAPSNKGGNFGPSAINGSYYQCDDNNGEPFEPSVSNSSFYQTKSSGFQWPPENNSPFAQTNNNGRDFGPFSNSITLHQLRNSAFQGLPEDKHPFAKKNSGGRFGPSADSSSDENGNKGFQWPPQNNSSLAQTNSGFKFGPPANGSSSNQKEGREFQWPFESTSSFAQASSGGPFGPIENRNCFPGKNTSWFLNSNPSSEANNSTSSGIPWRSENNNPFAPLPLGPPATASVHTKYTLNPGIGSKCVCGATKQSGSPVLKHQMTSDKSGFGFNGVKSSLTDGSGSNSTNNKAVCTCDHQSPQRPNPHQLLFGTSNTGGSRFDTETNSGMANKASFGCTGSAPSRFTRVRSSLFASAFSPKEGFSRSPKTSLAFGGSGTPSKFMLSKSATSFGEASIEIPRDIIVTTAGSTIGSSAPSTATASGKSAPLSIFGSTATSSGSSAPPSSTAIGSSAPTVGSIFGGAVPPTATSFGSSKSTPGSIFGSSVKSAPAAFGSSAPPSSTAIGSSAPTVGSIFGSAPTATIFGGAAPPTTTKQFGSSTSTPGSIFDSSATFAPTSGTIFGESAMSAPAAFGSPVLLPITAFGSCTPSDGSIFGTPATPSSTAFGSSAPSPGSLFGSSASPTTSFGTSAPTAAAALGNSSLFLEGTFVNVPKKKSLDGNATVGATIASTPDLLNDPFKNVLSEFMGATLLFKNFVTAMGQSTGLSLSNQSKHGAAKPTEAVDQRAPNGHSMEDSAVIIQRRWRAFLSGRKARKEFLCVKSAAVTFQRAWRKKSRNDIMMVETDDGFIDVRSRAREL